MRAQKTSVVSKKSCLAENNENIAFLVFPTSIRVMCIFIFDWKIQFGDFLSPLLAVLPKVFHQNWSELGAFSAKRILDKNSFGQSLLPFYFLKKICVLRRILGRPKDLISEGASVSRESEHNLHFKSIVFYCVNHF